MHEQFDNFHKNHSHVVSDFGNKVLLRFSDTIKERSHIGKFDKGDLLFIIA